MRWPFLAWALHSRRLLYLDAAAALRISGGSFSLKMAGRVEFLPHEQNRLEELLGLRKAFLFQEMSVPESARFMRQSLGNLAAWEDTFYASKNH